MGGEYAIFFFFFFFFFSLMFFNIFVSISFFFLLFSFVFSFFHIIILITVEINTREETVALGRAEVVADRLICDMVDAHRLFEEQQYELRDISARTNLLDHGKKCG
jgi:hypothetical protein